MASSQEYLDLILKQLQGLGQEISFRKMMGEYLLYYRGRLFGGIYDNRILLKPVQPALDFLKIRFMSLLIQVQSRCFV